MSIIEMDKYKMDGRDWINYIARIIITIVVASALLYAATPVSALTQCIGI